MCLSQATLGPLNGEAGRCLVSCKNENDEWIYIASLKDGQQESVTLDLVLSKYTEFKVEGPTAVHLSGYHMPSFDGETRAPAVDWACAHARRTVSCCPCGVRAH